MMNVIRIQKACILAKSKQTNLNTQTLNIMTVPSITIAQYVVGLVKSVNKPLEYALDITAWYCETSNQESEVKNAIKHLW